MVDMVEEVVEDSGVSVVDLGVGKVVVDLAAAVEVEDMAVAAAVGKEG